MYPSSPTATMTLRSPAQSADLRVRKMLGRSHLRANRLPEGIEIYTEILKDYPEDLEAMLILADLYYAAGDPWTAGLLYEKAYQVDPTNETIKSRIPILRPGEARPPILSPTDPRAIKRLLQQLSGRPEPPTEEEVEQAAALMTSILTSDSPAKTVAQHLDEIDALLPALLELNICQAYTDGRPDLADGLLQLQTNIALQMQRRLPSETGKNGQRLRERDGRSLLVLVANPERLSARMAMMIAAVRAGGMTVEVSSEGLSNGSRPDLILASNPHLTPRILETIALHAAQNVPVIVDLDTNFLHLPVDHPNYAEQALTTPASAKAYSTALLLANLITVPTEFEAQMLQNSGYPALAVADMWSRKNPYWQSQPRTSAKINIGWSNAFCQFEDLLEIRRILVRIMREFQDVRLVIIGDMNAYKLFDSLPLERRIFLPEIDEEESPMLFNQVDILAVPYRNIPFNCSLSDRPVMMAGVKGVPWVASNIPSISAWGSGGLVARSQEEWHANLRHLVMDETLRRTLGAEGKKAAAGREMDTMRSVWEGALRQALSGKRPEAMMIID